MEHTPIKPVKAHLDPLRKLCLEYPEVVEVEQFGSPWWKAGKKSFAIYGVSHGQSGASFKLTREEQAILVEADPRFSRARHIGQHGWTTMRLEGRLDWTQIEDLVDIAYRNAALKRMLKALDG